MTLIRPATSADVSALAAFAAVNFPDAAPGFMPREALHEFVSKNLNEAFFTHAIETGAFTFTLAVDEAGKIVGYTGIDHVSEQPVEVPGRAAYLSKFYLAAEARGGGLAGELMQTVFESARAAGCDGVHLGTHHENLRAQKFYEKMGFVQVGERIFPLTEEVAGQDYIYYLPLEREGVAAFEGAVE